ncbi:TRAP transporter small permease subunit [Cereibacter sphaeroides]|nr:TRAP transporter small permease subunit [Cereibacter sphaeroides]
MRRLAPFLVTTARVVRRLSEVAATLGFAALAGLMAYTVWQRYVMGSPSSWSDELAMILFLWVILGAAAVVVPYQEQIAVGLLSDRFPPRSRRWIQGVGAALAGIILLATLPITLDYIAFLWRERTPAMRWRLNNVYLIFGLFQGFIALSLLLRAALAVVGRDMPFDDDDTPAENETAS